MSAGPDPPERLDAPNPTLAPLAGNPAAAPASSQLPYSQTKGTYPYIEASAFVEQRRVGKCLQDTRGSRRKSASGPERMDSWRSTTSWVITRSDMSNLKHSRDSILGLGPSFLGRKDGTCYVETITVMFSSLVIVILSNSPAMHAKHPASSAVQEAWTPRVRPPSFPGRGTEI